MARYFVPIELIDHMGGALCSKSHRENQPNTEHYKAFYRKKTGTQSFGVIGVRTTTPSQAELARRQKFASVAASTKTRMLNATTLAQDKVAFAAQSRYKYLHDYVFAQEWANYAG